jgi:hypothetical protein
MEIPLANAKMTTIAVMKDFMAGLDRAEWLWNTVTISVLARNERKAFTQSVIFRVFCLDPSRRRPPARRCHRATVTAMVALWV